MESNHLKDLINSLSSDQQAAVEEFIKYLKAHPQQSSQVNFRELLDKFAHEHSELLQRLAQ